jgi:hypothetical protein
LRKGGDTNFTLFYVSPSPSPARLHSVCDASKAPRESSSAGLGATPVPPYLPPSPPWSPRSRVNEVGVSVSDRCEDETAGALPVVPSRSPRSGRRHGRRWVEALAKSTLGAQMAVSLFSFFPVIDR